MLMLAAAEARCGAPLAAPRLIYSDMLPNVFDTLIDQPLSIMFILIRVLCIFKVVHGLTHNMCKVDSTLIRREATAVNNKRIHDQLSLIFQLFCAQNPE